MHTSCLGFDRSGLIVLIKSEILIATGMVWLVSSGKWKVPLVFNPSSPNSDQHQFSAKDIHTLAREKVMRVNKMITKDLLSNSLNLFLKEMYRDQFREFVRGYWGLKS